IKRDEVYGEIEQTTAYVASRFPAEEMADIPERFGRIVSGKGDANLLNRYWEEGVSTLVEKLKSYVSDTEFSGDRLSLEFTVSGAYEETLTPSVAAGCFSYMVGLIASKWFRITFPGQASEYEERAFRRLTDIERQLCHRRPPVRKGNRHQ
ncbi:MAG: hypothetical protein K2K58_09665, partial [Muribaculaceae bacterium]|nr:hypothetical protein [Muribaculaceae bacterium]